MLQAYVCTHTHINIYVCVCVLYLCVCMFICVRVCTYRAVVIRFAFEINAGMSEGIDFFENVVQELENLKVGFFVKSHKREP